MNPKGTTSDAFTWLKRAGDTTWAKDLPREIDVLVLSLGCTLDKTETKLATSSVVSIRKGAEWYAIAKKSHKRCALIAVGAGYWQEMPNYEYDLMLEEALAQGVPAEDLFGEPHSFNTPMNAVCIAAALKGRRVGSIILTCDPIHASRAAATFRKIFDVCGLFIPITVRPGESPEYGDSSKWFLRSAITWWAWNLLGRILLPLHVRKIQKALAKR